MALGFSILDIGSAKVVCLICSKAGKNRFVVNGAGVTEYKGFRLSKFLDSETLKKATEDAIIKAEDAAKRSVVGIFVSVPASFSRIVLKKGVLSFANSHKVTYSDIDKLIEASMPEEDIDGYTLMHSSPVSYIADGVEGRVLPEGKGTSELASVVAHGYVEDEFKRTVCEILKDMQIRADLYIDSDLALASFLIDADNCENGAIMIDVGYFTTDVCYILNAAIVARKTIEVGGMHIANDLAYGLELPLDVAEGIKRRFVFALDYDNSVATIKIKDAGIVLVEDEAVALIIEARTEELINLIMETIDSFNVDLHSKPIYLTGGGIALMRGTKEYMSSIMGVPIIDDMPKTPIMNSQNYASAFAAANFLVEKDNLSVVMTSERDHNSLGRRIKDFFSK
ncbi:MAG: cell division FtsA domain-containing protein [Clostridia bacterium]